MTRNAFRVKIPSPTHAGIALAGPGGFCNLTPAFKSVFALANHGVGGDDRDTGPGTAYSESFRLCQ
jgi:hypothetical protein